VLGRAARRREDGDDVLQGEVRLGDAVVGVGKRESASQPTWPLLVGSAPGASLARPQPARGDRNVFDRPWVPASRIAQVSPTKPDPTR